jgi:hypothetical protein
MLGSDDCISGYLLNVARNYLLHYQSHSHQRLLHRSKPCLWELVYSPWLSWRKPTSHFWNLFQVLPTALTHASSMCFHQSCHDVALVLARCKYPSLLLYPCKHFLYCISSYIAILTDVRWYLVLWFNLHLPSY